MYFKKIAISLVIATRGLLVAVVVTNYSNRMSGYTDLACAAGGKYNTTWQNSSYSEFSGSGLTEHSDWSKYPVLILKV